ncbi:hypothetical protein [Oceanobacillus sp. J11TS1]|uniref:hypothetical protein n=1 Tax=Oceanobacillus sp. J11TS1 TaxID=2807191 RepID=UPI001B05B92F|nr:hypothetical protein [Oceanobacillus sp. J11TS1]GIO25226.1 hypothetical protein J11TS1_38070 [Oceanobacillus sp. J11TS1]
MAGGIMETVVYILVIGVVIFLLSIPFKEKRIILPVIASLISVLLFIPSFLLELDLQV